MPVLSWFPGLALTFLALQHVGTVLGVSQAVGTDAARSGSFAAGRSLLLAEPNSSDSSSPSGEDGNSDSAAPSSRKKRCEPSLIDVARTQPELRQLVQLAIAGYNVFSVDGGKNFTVLAPTNAALQNLAAGIEEQEDRTRLENGFYSVVLYHQLPQGALDEQQLLAAGGDAGLQTSLGRALGSGSDEAFTISLDGTARPIVATGGWPANNAQLLKSLEACNGRMYVIDAVLLPTQSLADLPRLVDDIPVMQSGSFWELLDGSKAAAAAAPAPPNSPGLSSGGEGGEQLSPEPGGGGGSGEAGAGLHSNSTDVVVSSGSGAPMPATTGNANSSSDGSSNGGDTSGTSGTSSGGGGGGSENVLIIAASVAGAAVAACAAVVAVVLLRKHAAARRRSAAGREQQQLQPEEGEGEDGGGFGLASKRLSSTRPVSLHVDA